MTEEIIKCREKFLTSIKYLFSFVDHNPIEIKLEKGQESYIISL